jgi:hypothetical protein
MRLLRRTTRDLNQRFLSFFVEDFPPGVAKADAEVDGVEAVAVLSLAAAGATLVVALESPLVAKVTSVGVDLPVNALAKAVLLDDALVAPPVGAVKDTSAVEAVEDMFAVGEAREVVSDEPVADDSDVEVAEEATTADVALLPALPASVVVTKWGFCKLGEMR